MPYIHGMDSKILERHFGGLSKTARALGVERQTVFGWRAKGVPLERQLQAEHTSGGELRACKEAREYGKRIASYLLVAA